MRLVIEVHHVKREQRVQAFAYQPIFRCATTAYVALAATVVAWKIIHTRASLGNCRLATGLAIGTPVLKVLAIFAPLDTLPGAFAFLGDNLGLCLNVYFDRTSPRAPRIAGTV